MELINYNAAKCQDEREVWLVKDNYGATVCACDKKHNAELIAKLLERYS